MKQVCCDDWFLLRQVKRLPERSFNLFGLVSSFPLVTRSVEGKHGVRRAIEEVVVHESLHAGTSWVTMSQNGITFTHLPREQITSCQGPVRAVSTADQRLKALHPGTVC